jgi:para-nitrobenzyl esterase
LFDNNFSANGNNSLNAVSQPRGALHLWCSRIFTKQRGKIYTYFFNRAIPWPEHPDFQAFHTGEVVYILSNLDKLPRPFADVDRTVAATTSGYLINFVRTGDPNGKGLPRWDAFTANNPATLEISGSTRMRPLMEPAKLEFWKNYFESPQSKNAPPF